MDAKESLQNAWNDIARAVQRKYSQITGDDLQSVQGNLHQLAGVIQRKTGQARDEIESYLKTVSSKGSYAMGAVSQAATDLLGKAGHGLREGYDYAWDATQEGYESAKKTVRQRPAESMAFALGIGVIVGMIAICSLFRNDDR